jgi:Fe-S cluster assembly protein SufD
MDTALADRLAARHYLHSQGWIARRSEHFRHLPPPALEAWIGPEPDAPACEAPALSGAGWLLQPVGPAATAGVDAHWLDALDPAQRNALFADLPGPGDGEACACASTHRPAWPPPTATPSGCTCITGRATPWKRLSWYSRWSPACAAC